MRFLQPFGEVRRMKTNKEVIEKLTAYYCTQDIAVVSRALACAMIDFNRISHLNSLDKEERDNLILGIKKNAEALKKFVKDGPDGNLELMFTSEWEKM